jgi:hypothetical protein
MRYRLARDRAFTSTNIASGFRAAGLYPLATADAWLEAYGEDHNIEMSTKPLEFIERRQNNVDRHPPSQNIDALNLQQYRPKKRKLPMPFLHSKVKKKPRLSIIGEKLSHAKILNLPPRLKALSDEQMKRKNAHEIILKKREERAERKVVKKKVTFLVVHFKSCDDEVLLLF